jgi:hypothetical protein
VQDSAVPDDAVPAGAAPAGAAPAGLEAAGPSPDVPPAPPWGQVLATTLRLWLQRRSVRARRLTAVVLAVAVLAAAVLIVLLGRHPSGPAAPRRTGRAAQASASPNPASQAAIAAAAAARQQAAAARQQAAAWVATQVSRSSIAACDPVMCSALQARGVPAASLLPLGPSAADPLGSAVVVSTAAIRSQFGARLASVYAPTILAAFGTGTARVEVRVTAPDGSAAYLSALRADVHGRMTNGAGLLRNSHISAPAAARRQLATGQVDARLLSTLVTLAGLERVRIVAFYDGGPGSSSGVPLRAVELASPRLPRHARGGQVGYLKSVLAFVHAQRALFLASSASLQRIGRNQAVLHIEFAAPSPLGLLGSNPGGPKVNGRP